MTITSDTRAGAAVLEAPAGSLAIWFSQSWYRRAANPPVRG
jgi:hypothetical protein